MNNIDDIKNEVDRRSMELILPLVVDKLLDSHWKMSSNRTECDCSYCSISRRIESCIKNVDPFPVLGNNVDSSFYSLKSYKEKRDYLRDFYRPIKEQLKNKY